MDVETLSGAISRSLARSEWEALENWAKDECTFTFNFGREEEDVDFDEAAFDLFIQTLNDSRFWEAPGSYHLLRILEYDWSLLTVAQRNKLLSTFAEIYPRMSDPMAHFVIAELIGENYASLEGLATIRDLRNRAAAIAQEFLPMALQHMVDSGTMHVAKLAKQYLLEMRTDPSPAVRNEAEQALRRISARGAQKN